MQGFKQSIQTKYSEMDILAQSIKQYCQIIENKNEKMDNAMFNHGQVDLFPVPPAVSLLNEYLDQNSYPSENSWGVESISKFSLGNLISIDVSQKASRYKSWTSSVGGLKLARNSRIELNLGLK